MITSSAGVDAISQLSLPFPHLYNDVFWNTLDHRSIGVLDPVHWYYSDAIFTDYADRIAAADLHAVRIFDYPFREMSSLVDQEWLLYQRTKLLVAKLKRTSTKVLSSFINKSVRNKEQLEYFATHRDLFDAYSFIFDFDAGPDAQGELDRLREVFQSLPKPVWVSVYPHGSSTDRIQFFINVINTLTGGMVVWLLQSPADKEFLKNLAEKRYFLIKKKV